MRNFWGFWLLALGLMLPSPAETFRNPRHIAIPSNPLQVGTADFNGDGRPDFYYADPSGLNVILANSDGSYAAPKTTAIGAATPQTGALGLSLSSCHAADFNGDGFADAVCFTVTDTPPRSHQPPSSLAMAMEPCVPAAQYPFPSALSQRASVLCLAFADINSDGHLDIVF